MPEGDNKVALDLLCDLYALSTIEADRAWFMEHGRLSIAALQGDQPRRSTRCAARSAPLAAASSTPSACRSRRSPTRAGRRFGGGRGLSRGELLIRPAIAADAAAIARVHVAAWRVGYAGLVDHGVLDALDESERARRWVDTLDGDDDALVAEDDDGLAGFASVAVPARDVAEPGVGEITALYVDPQRWRSGIGRALVDAAAAELREQGCDDVVLWTFEASEPSRAFYAALGFEPDGAHKPHPRTGVGEIRLRARLD